MDNSKEHSARLGIDLLEEVGDAVEALCRQIEVLRAMSSSIKAMTKSVGEASPLREELTRIYRIVTELTGDSLLRAHSLDVAVCNHYDAERAEIASAPPPDGCKIH